MAFDPDNFRVHDSVPGFGTIRYTSPDSIATILAAGYFDDAAEFMHKNDKIEILGDINGAADSTTVHVTTKKGVKPVIVGAQLTGVGAVPGQNSVGNTELAPNGVVPGTYTNANVQVDENGRIVNISNGAGGGGGSAQVLLGPTFIASRAYNVTADLGLYAQFDVSGGDVEIELPDTGSFAGVVEFYAEVNSSANAASFVAETAGQIRSSSAAFGYNGSADRVFLGLSQAQQRGVRVHVSSRGGIWQISGLLRNAVGDNLNPLGQAAILALADLADMTVVRPGANFQVNAATPLRTLFAPTGGAVCTVETMRPGQIVPFRNTAGAPYTFTPGAGVSLVGDLSVPANLAATIEAISATEVFVSAET